jgi:hypothetical protein
MAKPTTLSLVKPASSQQHRIAQPVGLSAVVTANDPTASVTAIAQLPGVPLIAKVGEPTAIAKIRKQINSLFNEPYKRAVAYILCAYPNEPKLPVEEIFALLDDIEAASRYHNKTWNWFHRNHKTKAEQCVSKIRSILRENGIPSN